MKKIITYLSLIMTAGMITVSCNLNALPEFDDKDAFVAFEKTTMSFKENSGIVEIPVTLASVRGLSSEVHYEAVDGDDPVKGAKAGKNYKLVDTDPVLNFDAEHRTCIIKVEIIPNGGSNEGIFTGDLSFEIHITETGNVAAGEESICKINILDLDHPLSSILSTYKMTAESYFNGPQSWELEFIKDPDDVSVVWIKSFVSGGGLLGVGGFYGVAKLNEANEVESVTLPLGQVNTEVTSTANFPPDGKVILFGFDVEADDLTDEGEFVITFSDNGSKLVYGTEYGMAVGGWTGPSSIACFDILYPGGTGVKK